MLADGIFAFGHYFHLSLASSAGKMSGHDTFITNDSFEHIVVVIFAFYFVIQRIFFLSLDILSINHYKSKYLSQVNAPNSM